MKSLFIKVKEMQTPVEKIDIGQYWNVVTRRKWTIIGITLGVGLLAGALLSTISPQYRATATLLIESQGENVVAIPDVYALDTRRQEYLQTQFEILKSRPLADKVIGRLELDKSDEFLPYLEPSALKTTILGMLGTKLEAQTPERREAALVAHYEDQLSITPVRATQLVNVSFESHSPEQAAAVANAHAQAYIESYLETRGQASGAAETWMGARLQELRDTVDASEKKLQAFKEREHLVDVNGIQSLSARELDQLSAKLVDARKNLVDIQSAYAQVEKVRNARIDDKLAIPVIKADPLVQQFRGSYAQANLKVAELKNRYGELHPKMKAAISERDAAQAILANQVNSVIDSIQNQHKMLVDQANSIASAVNSAKTDVQSVSRKESEYRALMSEVETNRNLYDVFQKRLSETRETSDLATPNARVVEAASVPTVPAKPRKLLFLALAMAGAFILAIIYVILIDIMNSKIRHAADVESRIGLTLLGLIPMLTKKKSSAGRMQYQQTGMQEFDESIRTVRTGVTLSALDQEHKVLLVASSLPSEGKTTVASNLAAAFSQIERVLLIDCDLRKPAVGPAFGIESNQVGLTEFVAASTPIKDCIVRDQASKVDILVAGKIPPNPQELINSRRLHALIEKLRENYDRIIIDCPPVLPVSDALLMGKLADAVIYVIKAESTTTQQARNGLSQFGRARIPVMGVVLNQINPDRLASYGEYGGGYSVGGYGYVSQSTR
ncbi:Predicted uncharacterized protein involved in exopolysaccharide biosynthesis [gamma proteobacterium HdN1]|nr:Predicted uncharacterized protein involved in exopolysaccharide biosynthesis [gamma proteobacterium HdN1]